jgi:uncharacterized membrane protein YgdD (TMEM256/DUF423 family)
MARLCLIAGGLLGGLSVAAGAFGAHGLRAMLDAAGQSANWETAARYCMYHALALVGVGLLGLSRPRSTAPLAAAAWCFFLGTLIFSGCLAALALTAFKPLGAVVPIGGVLLIGGWLLVALAAGRLTAESP